MATPAEFPEHKIVLKAPAGMPEVLPLPTRTEQGIVWSCWQLDPEEMMEIMTNGGQVWLGVVGGQPPVIIKGIKPEFDDDEDS